MVEEKESPLELRARLLMEQRKLAAVRELGRALGPNLDLPHVLATIVDKVPQLLNAERATLYVMEEPEGNGHGHGDSPRLVSKALIGGRLVPEIRLNLGEGIAGTVAQTGQPLKIADAYQDPRFNPDVDRRTGFHTRSILCVPIPDHGGKITGVLQALNRCDGGAFDGDDEALLVTLAAYLGVSLENSKLYQSLLSQNAELLRTQHDLQQRVDELDLLYQIERESSGALDLQELLVRLTRRAAQLVFGAAAIVALRQPSGELDATLFSLAAGAGPATMRRARIPHGQGLIARAVQLRQPLLSDDLSAEPEALGPLRDALGLEPRQALVIPLDHIEAEGVDQDGDEALGAIAVFDKTVAPHHFDRADQKLLTLLAGHAARAIVLSRTRTLRIREGNLASIGRMLTSVMHDLRTPMTIILGYAQLMAASEDAEERERYVKMIKKQFELLEAMTGEVLAFARGESKLLVRRVLLTRFVEEVREQLQRELGPVELQIDARYLGAAYFDELKLLRLIHNLARNAAQAMPRGGVFRITIDTADAPAAPGMPPGYPQGQGKGKDSSSARRELVFTFFDTGGGLPEEVQASLFEAFTSANKEGGTGLGLAIVKKIVDDHHGRISVTTRRGEGTTFTVAIPLSRE